MAPADSRGGGGAANNPGNFANDPARAAEAGHKGASTATRHPMPTRPTHRKRRRKPPMPGGHTSGNFADDPQRAAEAGRKGGQHSHSKT
ncbi:KGG domain-containing protein [Komagataeibacter rhaeticus]|nr:KGG domain-containing protein [Komagataeibacter rhaeticus]